MSGVSGAELEPMWRAGPYLKLAPGTYVAKLEGDSAKEPMYTLNGFYPATSVPTPHPPTADRPPMY